VTSTSRRTLARSRQGFHRGFSALAVKNPGLSSTSSKSRSKYARATGVTVASVFALHV